MRWPICPVVVLLCACAIPCVADDLSVSLTFLNRFSVESGKLNEPSGLALTHQKRGLWTVDDEAVRVFQLDIDDGEIDSSDTFDLDLETGGFEGIALHPDGSFLYLVVEDTNSVVQVDRARESVVQSQPLSGMGGFDEVAEDFRTGGANKGLEGITVLPDGAICVLKEGNPGLLLRISPDLSAIEEVVHLNIDSGFTDNDTPDDEIDFSGICFDEKRNRCWIVSDKARRLYQFDLATEQVQQSFALGYGLDGELHEIDKAEGVALDTTSDCLYIVSDSEAALYVYQAH